MNAPTPISSYRTVTQPRIARPRYDAPAPSGIAALQLLCAMGATPEEAMAAAMKHRARREGHVSRVPASGPANNRAAIGDSARLQATLFAAIIAAPDSTLPQLAALCDASLYNTEQAIARLITAGTIFRHGKRVTQRGGTVYRYRVARDASGPVAGLP